MDTLLTETELTRALNNIKRALSIFAAPELQKVTFISLESLLHHTDDRPPNNLPTLLDRVAPYIPLAITSQNIEDFMAAALRNDEDELQALEASFIYDSKIKFINSIFTTKTVAEWNEILSICHTIRRCKEESRQRSANMVVRSHL